MQPATNPWSEQLRRARTEAGLSVKEVARTCSVWPATIASYEAGVDYPTGKTLARLKGMFPVLRNFHIERPLMTAQLADFIGAPPLPRPPPLPSIRDVDVTPDPKPPEEPMHDAPPKEQVLVPMKPNQLKRATPTFASWGEALGFCMKQEQMSARQVAELVGVGNSIVYAWKNNAERPGADKIEAIHKLFPAMNDAPGPIPSRNSQSRKQAKVQQQRVRRAAKKVSTRRVTLVQRAYEPEPEREPVRAEQRVTRTLFDAALTTVSRLYEESIKALTELARDHGAEEREIDYAMSRAELRAGRQSLLERKR